MQKPVPDRGENQQDKITNHFTSEVRIAQPYFCKTN
jgi:hypothetical protein